MSDVEKRVRSFIEDNFLFRNDCGALSDGESLLMAGLIDSTGILELVAFLEQEFRVPVPDFDIVPADLDSIRAIVAYVEGRLARPAAA